MALVTKLLTILSLILSVMFSQGYALKEKVYFAGRIPKNPNPEMILPLHQNMGLLDVEKTLKDARLEREHYIRNGPWVFAYLSPSGEYEKGKVPGDISSVRFVRMILGKMMQSSVIVATISEKTYGTIAEIGYAVAKGNVPVYVFPDPSLTREAIRDLWFVFQMGAMTSHLWKAEHFQIPDLFPQKTTLGAYKAFLKDLKPPFL